MRRMLRWRRGAIDLLSSNRDWPMWAGIYFRALIAGAACGQLVNLTFRAVEFVSALRELS